MYYYKRILPKLILDALRLVLIATLAGIALGVGVAVVIC